MTDMDKQARELMHFKNSLTVNSLFWALTEARIEGMEEAAKVVDPAPFCARSCGHDECHARRELAGIIREKIDGNSG